MPLNIPDGLPAFDVLQRENIFCMANSTAQLQDIRPIRVLLLNLMPKKIETEIHLLRMLSNSPLQVEDRKSTRLNSSHVVLSYAVFCLKKKTIPSH